MGYSFIAVALEVFPAVNGEVTLAYCFAKHDHYKHFSIVRAWTFLSQQKLTAIT